MQTVVVTEIHRLSPHSNLVTAAMPEAAAKAPKTPAEPKR